MQRGRTGWVGAVTCAGLHAYVANMTGAVVLWARSWICLALAAAGGALVRAKPRAA